MSIHHRFTQSIYSLAHAKACCTDDLTPIIKFLDRLDSVQRRLREVRNSTLNITMDFIPVSQSNNVKIRAQLQQHIVDGRVGVRRQQNRLSSCSKSMDDLRNCRGLSCAW